MSTVLSKLIESILLSQLLPELEDRGFPSVIQIAYQHGVSCEDATFSVYATVSHFVRNRNTVLQTFYDLEKAFDSVECCVLLKHLFSRGINGKCWRLVRSYYDGPTCHMKCKNSLSQEFVIERGVRQGSFLSLSLFLLLMDGLLNKLSKANAGLTLGNIYAGSMAHAVIEKFLLENFLKLNCDKCEILVHSSGNSTPDITVHVGSHSLKPVTASRCLGTWWTSDLMPRKAIAENIAKARRAFFAYGSIGAFHGDLNPLSARGIVEVCVMPFLLFGCEN